MGWDGKVRSFSPAYFRTAENKTARPAKGVALLGKWKRCAGYSSTVIGVPTLTFENTSGMTALGPRMQEWDAG